MLIARGKEHFFLLKVSSEILNGSIRKLLINIRTRVTYGCNVTSVLNMRMVAGLFFSFHVMVILNVEEA